MFDFDNPEPTNLNTVRILRKIQPHVSVSRYPKKKSSVIKFNIPETIQGYPVKRYLSLTFGLTRVDQEFILDNLRYCREIQPNKTTVIIIGFNDPNSKPTIVTTTEYGTFHIFGKKISTVYDPKDINSYVATYICTYGITAHVHVYKFRGKYVTNVYYGSSYEEPLDYLKLMSTEQLYAAFIADNIERLQVCIDKN